MQKKKQVYTWPISVLVIVVSFLSVLVVLRQVQAVWQEPTSLPQDTSLSTFVFNPLAQDIVLNGKNITGTGGINISGAASFTTLNVGGVPITGGGGGGGSSNDWAINYSSNRALYYATTSSASNGNVGIGIATPATKLHINDGVNGPIVTLSGLNSNYKGLTIKNESDAEQWFAGSNASNNYVVRRNSDVDYFNVNATTGDVNIAQNLAVGGNLTVTGTINGASGGATASDWATLSGSLYYTTSTGNGRVGIGTNTPNKLLHLYSTSPNAELDIQSVSGTGNHWAIYHDSTSNDLLFWKGGANRVTLADTGEVGIGAVPHTNYQLYAFTNTESKIAIRGSSASGTGLYGNGVFGVRAIAVGDNSIGIIAQKSSSGTGSVAGNFIGDVVIGNGFLQLPSNNIGSGCADEYLGRMAIDSSTSGSLHVCIGNPAVWRQITLN